MQTEWNFNYANYVQNVSYLILLKISSVYALNIT